REPRRGDLDGAHADPEHPRQVGCGQHRRADAPAGGAAAADVSAADGVELTTEWVGEREEEGEKKKKERGLQFLMAPFSFPQALTRSFVHSCTHALTR